MREYLISARDLLWGILKRGYFLFFALFLDPVDIYSRFKPAAWEMPVPDWAIWIAFGVTFALAVFLSFHEARTRPAPKPKRMPLLDLRAYCKKRGWKFGQSEMDALDFVEALVQGAIDGDVEFWGKFDEYGRGPDGSWHDEPLTRIPPEHFKKYRIEVVGLVMQDENRRVFTHSYGVDNHRSGGYLDLHVSIPALRAWEKSARKTYHGNAQAKHDEEERLRKKEEEELEAS